MKPPHIKAKKEKEFRKILKRQYELYKAIRDLGYIKLEEPIRHGWYRELVITHGISKYKHAEEYLEVYNKIQTDFWGKTKEKAQEAWDRKCSLYMLSKDKPTISKKQFNRLSDEAKHICVPFRYKTRSRNWKTRFYVNFPKGCTKIKFTKAYITHRKRIDPNLQSELNFLQGELLKPKLYELDSKGYWNRWDRMSKSFKRKNEAHRVKERLSKFRNKVINDDLERVMNNE